MPGKTNLSVLIFCAIAAGVIVSHIACKSTEPVLPHGEIPDAHSPKVDRKFMQRYVGDVVIPEELLAAYSRFAEAAKKADMASIQEVVLPHAVRVYFMMPANAMDRSEDIRTWGFGERFIPDVLVIRNEAKNIYLIRTASCATWWVQTGDMGWMLYHYLEKPIE